MCVSGCMTSVRARLLSGDAANNDDNSKFKSKFNSVSCDSSEGLSSRSSLRRNFLRGLATSTVATGMGVFFGSSALAAMDADPPPLSKAADKGSRKKRLLRRGIKGVVDLTHRFDSNFPTFGGNSGIKSKKLVSFAQDGYNAYRHDIFEHAGTHIDAPLHFSADGQSVDELSVEQLVAPLVRLDLRRRAADDADLQVTPADLRSWEKKHGKIPLGACVALDSGWDRFVSGKKFRNADSEGTMHFPGFHVDAVNFLLAERDISGIAVDTLSLDYGRSQDFAVHYAWLPQGKWGLECVANLSSLPSKGAVIVVGAPKWRGGSGGLTRVIALV